MERVDPLPPPAAVTGATLGVVVIGRNEGERLRTCLLSVQGVEARVYVDSGSTDGSSALARSLGFDVVELTRPPGFTAARARNAGLDRLLQTHPTLAYVQMIDGDCEMEAGWLDVARPDIEADARRAVVFGRRHERHPAKNAFHMACDDEWNVQTGEVNSCGGDALFRVAALAEAGGYNGALIAGEEPDLCLRLRQRGWRVWSNGRDMTWHDIAMRSMTQWLRRSQRTGFGFAYLVALHGRNADPVWHRLIRSAVGWSAVMVSALAVTLLGLAMRQPLVLALGCLLAALPAVQLARLVGKKRARGASLSDAMRWAALTMIAKLAETHGWLQFHVHRLVGTQKSLIEYKASPAKR